MNIFEITLTLISFLLFFIRQVTPKNVINTCGKKITYNEPQSAEDCVVEGQICCFVSIKDDKDGITKFCVSSPSDIEKKDVEKEIKDYTGFTVVDLHCNKSQYIHHSIIIQLFISIFYICIL